MRKLLTRPVTAWKALMLAAIAGPLGGALIDAVKAYLYCKDIGARVGITYGYTTTHCLRLARWVFIDFLSGW